MVKFSKNKNKPIVARFIINVFIIFHYNRSQPSLMCITFVLSSNRGYHRAVYLFSFVVVIACVLLYYVLAPTWNLTRIGQETSIKKLFEMPCVAENGKGISVYASTHCNVYVCMHLYVYMNIVCMYILNGLINIRCIDAWTHRWTLVYRFSNSYFSFHQWKTVFHSVVYLYING